MQCELKNMYARTIKIILFVPGGSCARNNLWADYLLSCTYIYNIDFKIMNQVNLLESDFKTRYVMVIRRPV